MADMREISIFFIRNVTINKKKTSYNENMKMSFIPLISMSGAVDGRGYASPLILRHNDWPHYDDPQSKIGLTRPVGSTLHIQFIQSQT